MPRPKTKDELLKAAEENYGTLMAFIDGMTEEELSTPFDFSGQPGKKEAHWSRDKNVRDVLIHLYEWHKLMLQFPKNNAGVTDGKKAISILPPEYSWKSYGAMNMMFWKRNQEISLESARRLLSESHADVMRLIGSYSDEELFTAKHFCWTGNSSLGSYFVSNTSSHYDWALKKLRAHRRNCTR
ncbi:MAG: ClbS/DfsB family four-helix bundle protein [Treponema sp.]|nr:ClbS/DfsB family four-helix bundle protein [Treponema sp.]MBQ6567271.1 ClbS/DfsB family four-helix bundle protein [Treponema sp.]